MKQRPFSVWQVSNGFTLIELMVAVAIIAILSSVAVPMYSDYVRRGQLPEAFSSLSDYRVKMEQYYQDNRNYGTAACADIVPGPTWNTFSPAGRKYFTFACAITAAGQGYTITATGGSGAAVGHDYTVNQSGIQATTKYKGATLAKTCWMAKGDEC